LGYRLLVFIEISHRRGYDHGRVYIGLRNTLLS